MIRHQIKSHGADLLRDLLALCGPGTTLIEAREREWASVTFTGARHVFDLTVPLSNADAADPPALAVLPEHDFALRGEIVADCAVTRARRHRAPDGWRMDVRVELLTITAD